MILKWMHSSAHLVNCPTQHFNYDNKWVGIAYLDWSQLTCHWLNNDNQYFVTIALSWSTVCRSNVKANQICSMTKLKWHLKWNKTVKRFKFKCLADHALVSIFLSMICWVEANLLISYELLGRRKVTSLI